MALELSPGHKLNENWTFYHYNPDKDKTKNKHDNWLESLSKMITVDTVEDVFNTVDYLVDPWNLPLGQHYYVFREDIPPQFESPENKMGGKWVFQDKKLTNWVEILCLLIGATKQYPDMNIQGIIFKNKKQPTSNLTCEIWINNYKSAYVKDVGRAFCKLLKVPGSFKSFDWNKEMKVKVSDCQ